MKAIFLMLLSLSVLAGEDKAPIGSIARFDRIGIADFVQAFYGDFLHGSFAIEPELIETRAKAEFQFEVPKKDPALARELVEHYLRQLGIGVEQYHGMSFVRRVGAEGRPVGERLVYHIQHRTANYLAELVRPLFKDLVMTERRDVRNVPMGINAQQVLSPSAMSNGQPVAPGQQVPYRADSAEDLIDQPADVLVFAGAPDRLKDVQAFLADIDTPEKVAKVTAYLYETSNTVDSGHAVGLAVSTIGHRLGISLGQGQLTSDNVSLSVGGVQAVVSALNADNRFKLVSAPVVNVKTGQSAGLTVGQDVPVLGAITTTAQGATQQSIVYQSSGVIFNVTPTVRDKELDLKVDQEVSSFQATTTGVNNTPTKIERKLSTTLTLKPGDVVLLGGLKSTKDTNGSSGPSFLPSWLRSATQETESDDVFLVLSAEVQ